MIGFVTGSDSNRNDNSEKIQLTMHVASVCVYFKRRQVVIPFPNKPVMGRRDGQQMCEGQDKEKAVK